VKRRKSGARSAGGEARQSLESQRRVGSLVARSHEGAWPWILAGVLAFLSAALTFDPRLYVNGDNVSYMFLARDVLGGELWPSSKFPPLFPWLLAPAQWIAGSIATGSMAIAPPRESLLAQKLLVLAFHAGAIAFLVRILRRRMPLPTGPVVAFVAATLLPVIEYAHYVMSEIPYLFFLAGSLDAADRLLARSHAPREAAHWSPQEVTSPESAEAVNSGPGSSSATRSPSSRSAFAAFVSALRSRGVWELALWVAAGFYTRSAGISAGIGIGIALLARRRFSAAFAYAGAFAILALPWVVRGMTTSGGNPYVDQFLLVNPYYPEFGRLDAGGLVERFWFNLRSYAELHIPASLVPFPYRSTYSPPIWQKTLPPVWVTIPILLGILAGSIRMLRRFDPAAWAAIVSILLVLIWPPVWAANRFLIPLAPFLLWLFWEGLRVNLGRAAVLGAVRAVTLVILVAHGLLALRNYEVETRVYDPVWGNYFATIDWIAKNTTADAHIIDRKPGFVEFQSGRSAETFPREPDLDRMVEFLRTSGADYVLLNRLPYDDIGRFLVPVVNQRREHFEVVYQLHDPERDPTLNGDAFVLRFIP
jgi:hypothetical protein